MLVTINKLNLITHLVESKANYRWVHSFTVLSTSDNAPSRDERHSSWVPNYYLKDMWKSQMCVYKCNIQSPGISMRYLTLLRKINRTVCKQAHWVKLKKKTQSDIFFFLYCQIRFVQHVNVDESLSSSPSAEPESISLSKIWSLVFFIMILVIFQREVTLESMALSQKLPFSTGSAVTQQQKAVYAKGIFAFGKLWNEYSSLLLQKPHSQWNQVPITSVPPQKCWFSCA